MYGAQNEAWNVSMGTTSPIFIPRDPESPEVRPGESYFIVKIQSAQAAFAGSIWKKVKRLIVTSQVTLNHPALGGEPLRAIQRSREVRGGRAEQLGLSPNLINLVPASMDRVSISIEFILDTENRLVALGGLINDDSFLAAVSLAPGAAIAARTIAGLSQKILNTFLEAKEREPILQFSGDFNIPTGELRDGYYVILGTRDKESPFPRPLPVLSVQNNDVLAGGSPVTQWSYVLLDVRCLPARTRDLNGGASWATKMRQAEAVAQRLSSNPFAEKEEKQSAWEECMALLKESQVLLLDDTNYLEREGRDIVKASYARCYEDIWGREARARALTSPGVPADVRQDPEAVLADRAVLGIPSDENLEDTLDRYADEVLESRRVIKGEGIL